MLTHTHLLTHPHSNYSFSRPCGIQATVAWLASTQAPHLASSCASVRVEKQGVVWLSMRTKYRCQKRKVITVQGSYSGRTKWGHRQKLVSKTCAQRMDCMGRNERIINLSQSDTPVSPQRHWSRNIGLHPPATTLMPCTHLPSCKRKTSKQGRRTLSLIYFAFRSPSFLHLRLVSD